ncbi:MAG: hypothetical protein C4541_10710 [Candidatus Auribacter fodinae]|jgi:hypothetical protein|uniref:Glycosyltransferase RgtA/B/C/D-like domain-containing protein n=1 Tax=Candidatus Auribacter fodinae TaxID=2093366 RepID=A0A3A4R4E4_9BACT|nr:MAG: hypothetical protein C4541_10710 [Candidatus Auribacter fodinae]
MQKKSFLFTAILIASVAAVLTYNYCTLFTFTKLKSSMFLHKQIIHGKALSPYNYRILVPVVTETAAKLLCGLGVMKYKEAWTTTYAMYYFTAIFLFLMTLFLFLKQWHNPLLSLIGTLFCAGLLPVALMDHYFQPGSLLEAWLFCAAFLASCKSRYVAVAIITVIASFNRETGIFIPFVYLFGALDIKSAVKKPDKNVMRQIVNFMALTLISAGVVIGIRYMQGFSGVRHTISDVWTINTYTLGLLIAPLHLVLFLGGGWVLAALGFRKADRFTRQETLIIPLYIIPVAIFGIWREVRLLIPLYPLLISLCLFYVRDECDGVGERG